MKLFKGIGDLLRVGRDGIFKGVGFLARPFKGLVIKYLADSTKKEFKDAAIDYFLGYLAEEYEDKAFAEILKYNAVLFDTIEKAIPILPDFMEPAALKKIKDIEGVILKYIARLDKRITEMKADKKICNTERDELVHIITVEAFAELMLHLTGIKDAVLSFFKIEGGNKEESPKVAAKEVEPKEAIELKIFSTSARETLKTLSEKHSVK